MARPHPRILPYGTAAIATAAALIRDGRIVAIPSETVYGLAADATNPTAVAQIYAAKGRPSFNPLIVHVTDLAWARRIGMFDADALALAEAFWPGPLTLVVPLRPGAGIASLVTAGLDTIALRVPNHRAFRALIDASGKPLAAPSANASGGISPTRAAHVETSLDDAVPLIIDDGATEAGLESTIVMGRQILRPGPIIAESIADLFSREGGSPGAKHAPPETTDTRHRGKVITAPGQLDSHYAPGKPLRLGAATAQPDEWLIGFGPVAGHTTLSRTGDLSEAAAALFDLLHQADANDRAKIAIAPIPDTGLGAAINDRLRRAAHR